MVVCPAPVWIKVITEPIGKATEEFNGTSWSAGGALITARVCLSGAGASNISALAFGGNTASSVATRVSCTEAYT